MSKYWGLNVYDMLQWHQFTTLLNIILWYLHIYSESVAKEEYALRYVLVEFIQMHQQKYCYKYSDYVSTNVILFIQTIQHTQSCFALIMVLCIVRILKNCHIVLVRNCLWFLYNLCLNPACSFHYFLYQLVNITDRGIRLYTL